MKRYFVLLSLVGLALLQACGGGQSPEEHSNDDADSNTSQAESLEETYKPIANEIIEKTFTELSSTLKAVIDSAGPAAAIGYCNVHAYPITDKYESDGIEIRRTSMKYRNPDNAPSEIEKEYLEKLSMEGKEAEYLIKLDDGSVHMFKPIMALPLCLNCHGDTELNIQPDVLAQINELYPDDKATGYKLDEFRGMWHVSFPPDYVAKGE